MDMGIVNAGMVGVYDDLDPELRERVEDVVLNRRPDAGERLIEIARAKSAGKGRDRQLAGAEWQPAGRAALSHALVQGHHRVHRGRHRGGLAAAGAAVRCT